MSASTINLGVVSNVGSAISSRFGNAQLAVDANDIPDDAYQYTSAGNTWAYGPIDETRWNEQWPYQIVLYKKNDQGGWDRQSISYTLPIPPTDLTRNTPSAIQTIVTLGGIIEEHNGAPLRSIQFNGTTGVLPIRPGGQPTAPLPFANAIFAGTIQGINGVITNATAAVMGPQGLFTQNIISNSSFGPGGTLSGTSGYFQFRMLEQFFDYYYALKKTDVGRNWVMALEIHKDQGIFLVTLDNFTLRRSAGSPLEYEYSLGFRAWRRIIDTTQTNQVTPVNDVTSNPNALAQVLSSITAARATLVSVSKTLAGLNSDINALVFEPIRQVAMFCKDGLGVALTCADLPVSIVQSMKGAILESAGVVTTANQVSSAFSNLPAIISAEIAQCRAALKEFSVTSGQSLALSGQQPSTALALQTSPDPGNLILSNPANYYSVFSLILPSTLNLTAVVQNAIQAQRVLIRGMTRMDFQNIRDNLVSFSANYANAVGFGDPTYNATFGIVPTPTTRTPTTDDLIALDGLNDVVLQINQLVASPSSAAIPDPISYVAALASPFGITLQIPLSKTTIPFPYQSTLEMVAAAYLGDADRWLEIAALNNLQEPYIDEVGFDINLIVNGRFNEVTISATDPNAVNLYVGQACSIVSNIQQRDYRTIAALTTLGTTIVIQVSDDGTDQDLGVFRVIDQASFHAFLPGTVNSQQIIFIPSTQEEDQVAINGAPNEALANFQAQLQQGGADLLLTSTFDLAITPDGDCRLAIGLANLIQRVRLIIQTPIHSLYRHPEYGWPLTIGQSQGDFTAEQILAIVSTQFQNDQSFAGVRGVQVIKEGGTTTINMSVQVRGSGQYLPLSFQIVPPQGTLPQYGGQS